MSRKTPQVHKFLVDAEYNRIIYRGISYWSLLSLLARLNQMEDLFAKQIIIVGSTNNASSQQQVPNK